MIDGKLQIIGADTALGEDHMELVFITGIAIPVGMGPSGPQFVPIQDGVYRVPMRKETAIDFANKILETADELPDTEQQKSSDILVASNMNDVQNVARQAQQFRDPRA